jgi:uncharacterized protein (TIGR00299 family) protein
MLHSFGRWFDVRVVYFDCISGISGDMALGAFIDSGADVGEIVRALKELRLPEFEIAVEKVNEGGIAATKVKVNIDSTHEPHGRRPTEIIELIESSKLSEGVKRKAIKAFEHLAIAEAKVHGVSVDEVHLHEVGAIDAIIDIVGTMLAMHMLGIERAFASRLPYSSGWAKSAHGLLPVPAPATLELLKDAQWRHVDIDAELVTPTGAAILKATCKAFGTFPPLSPTSIGYGAGHARLPIPNLLRVVIGELASYVTADETHEQLFILETNIDDMPAEWFGHVVEKLFELGALDAYIIPVQMKKTRPAAQLNVLCNGEKVRSMLDCIFSETTTLGVRIIPVERVCLLRETFAVSTPFGDVRVKVARRGEHIINISPEYEDCKEVAKRENIPLKLVVEVAMEEAKRKLSGSKEA